MSGAGGDRSWMAPVLLLLLIWGLLDLPGLASRPTYYVDEGYAVDLARGWADGRLGGAAYERPLAAYMPLHRWLLWPSVALGGDPILWGRLLSASVVLAVGLVLWIWFRRALGGWLALLPALWLIGYEQSLVLYRMAYPHALCGFGILLLFGWWGSRWWVRAAGTALCFWTHQFALPALALATLCFIRRRRDLVAIVGTAAISVVLFALLLFLHGSWPFVLQDLGWQSSQLTEDLENTGASWWTPWQVGWQYHTQDFFHLMALLAALTGLWRREVASLAYLILSAFLLWQRTNILVFNYPDLLLMPLAAKVFADGLWAARKFLARADVGAWCVVWPAPGPALWARRSLFGRVLLAVLLAAAGGQIAFGLLAVRTEQGLPLRFQPWATQDMREFRAVVEWLNERTEAGDLVLANPTLASQLRATSVDWLTATLARGVTTTFSPTPWAENRFPRPVRAEDFSFVVVGDSDVVWALGQPNVEETYAQFRDWPVVLATLRFVVKQNPGKLEEVGQ